MMSKVMNFKGKSQRKKMSQMQFDRIKKYYEDPRNNERLFALMKTGDYLEFVENVGYMYAVKIGETEDMDVMLKVSIAGKAIVHGGFLQVIPGVVKELNLA